jgi:hypothetical protein
LTDIINPSIENSTNDRISQWLRQTREDDQLLRLQGDRKSNGWVGFWQSPLAKSLALSLRKRRPPQWRDAASAQRTWRQKVTELRVAELFAP